MKLLLALASAALTIVVIVLVVAIAASGTPPILWQIVEQHPSLMLSFSFAMVGLVVVLVSIRAARARKKSCTDVATSHSKH